MLLRRNIPISYIVRKVKHQLVIVTIYSSMIYVLKNFVNIQHLSIPLTIPSILGTTISLLLAFRTNQSYDRWWEARIAWGSIVNDSRSLVRQATTFTKYNYNHDKESDAIVKRIANRQIAWCYVLGASLKNIKPIVKPEIFIEEDEMVYFNKSDNKANALLHYHSIDIQKLLDIGAISYHQQQQLDSTVTKLCDSMGRCERIKNTVFPSTYSIFIDIFVYLFSLSLPLSLIDVFGISEIPLTALIVSAFFLIEKTAIHMQDPFENRPTDTAVDAIATNIEINIKNMLGGEQFIPQKIQPKEFYLP